MVSDNIGTTNAPNAGAPPLDRPTQNAASTASDQNANPSMGGLSFGESRADAGFRDSLPSHLFMTIAQTFSYKQCHMPRRSAVALRDAWQRTSQAAIKS
jgi:hypothetical protein